MKHIELDVVGFRRGYGFDEEQISRGANLRVAKKHERTIGHNEIRGKRAYKS